MNWPNGGRLGVICTRTVPLSVSSSPSCSYSRRILRSGLTLLPSSRSFSFSSSSSSWSWAGPSPSSSSNTRLPVHAAVPPATSCPVSFSYRYTRARHRGAGPFRYCGHLRMASSLLLPKFPVFDAIAGHDPHSPAVVHCLSGRTFRYGEILPDVCRVRDRIYAAAGKSDIRGERVAFLIENSYDYVGMCCNAAGTTCITCTEIDQLLT